MVSEYLNVQLIYGFCDVGFEFENKLELGFDIDLLNIFIAGSSFG